MQIDRFQWSEDLSVSNAALDGDHKAFINIANLLLDWKNHEDMLVESALMMLREYIDGHFLREEKAMKAVAYPYYAGHRLKHAQFKAKVISVC